MSLYIDVTDSSNGNPITDAVFATSGSPVSANDFGTGWYWVLIGQNTDFVCSDQANQYYPAGANTSTWTSLYVSLVKKKTTPW